MSESLRRELILFGIDVIVIGPGAIATPIWDKAEALDISSLASTPYGNALGVFKDYAIANGRKGLPPEAVGEAVKTALTVSRPKTRYTVTPDPIRDVPDLHPAEARRRPNHRAPARIPLSWIATPDQVVTAKLLGV